jgi:hypothetical protein
MLSQAERAAEARQPAAYLVRSAAVILPRDGVWHEQAAAAMLTA